MNYHITIIIECISILFLNMVLWSLMLPHVAPCCPQIAKMIGRCEAEASGWRGRDPHISLVPRCANPLWANLTKRCIQYTLTRTHIDIHTHIVYLYIHRCITYVQFIMNYMRIYRIFLLKACCMTFIEPGDFHRTISRDMARHANAMRMPCECQCRSRVALTWKLSMDCCSRAEVLWTPKNVAVPQKRVSVSKMFLGFGKVR